MPSTVNVEIIWLQEGRDTKNTNKIKLDKKRGGKKEYEY